MREVVDNLERVTRSTIKVTYLDNRKPVRFNFKFCYLLHNSFKQDPQFMIKANKIELEMRNTLVKHEIH